MADKQVTVPVPEERVAEFYAWFAAFLVTEPGRAPGPGGRGPRVHQHRGGSDRREHSLGAWSAGDGERAVWLYERLAPAARELFDLLATSPDKRYSGNEVAALLRIDKGAHGVAGILAWPGRYARRLDRAMPIATEGRVDGGTDYFMQPEVAGLFAPGAAAHGGSGRADRPRHHEAARGGQ